MAYVNTYFDKLGKFNPDQTKGQNPPKGELVVSELGRNGLRSEWYWSPEEKVLTVFQYGIQNNFGKRTWTAYRAVCEEGSEAFNAVIATMPKVGYHPWAANVKVEITLETRKAQVNLF